MMFFKRKPDLTKVLIAAPKLPQNIVEIAPKTISRPDSDGQIRRMLRTMEDNRLL